MQIEISKELNEELSSWRKKLKDKAERIRRKREKDKGEIPKNKDVKEVA